MNGLSSIVAYLGRSRNADKVHRKHARYRLISPPLSAREAEIMEYRSRGFTVSKTAAALGISESTVKTHRRLATMKLGT